jgi:hypothetical protein
MYKLMVSFFNSVFRKYKLLIYEYIFGRIIPIEFLSSRPTAFYALFA